MVFYKGKAPSGRKTKWKMNEYRAIEQPAGCAVPKLRNELSLCRVYVSSGSFRSFDRRPLGSETSRTGFRQIPGDPSTQTTQTVEKISSSSESSSSGEDPFEFSQTNLGMYSGLEPLLESMEWDQLNWV